MRIGALAKQVGVNPKTVRYYEAIGLLPEPPRTAAGYRRYDQTAVTRLEFVQRAKRLGLSLESVGEILAIRERGEAPCERVVALVDAELNRIDRRVAELARLRGDLAAVRRRWETEPTAAACKGCICRLIDG